MVLKTLRETYIYIAYAVHGTTRTTVNDDDDDDDERHRVLIILFLEVATKIQRNLVTVYMCTNLLFHTVLKLLDS